MDHASGLGDADDAYGPDAERGGCLRNFRADVGPLLADAGTDAGGEKTFRKLHDRVKECGRLARGRSGVPARARVSNCSDTASSDSIPSSASSNHSGGTPDWPRARRPHSL